jgi:hypothetical protein
MLVPLVPRGGILMVGVLSVIETTNPQEFAGIPNAG